MDDSVKIVGLDMDGTLLGKDRILTQHTIEVMEKVAARGVNLVVDSGRLFTVVPEELRNLPFMRYFILCNGAEIYDKWEDKVIYRAEIPLDTAIAIYDELINTDEDVFVDCYMEGDSWARAEDYARIEEFGLEESHKKILYETRKPVENYREAMIKRGKPIYKWQTIYSSDEACTREINRLKKIFPELAITSAYTYNIEINVPEATKGGGLRMLADILGYDMKQVIAFGDGRNDISMFEAAGTGYAMGNAPDYIKAKADRIAPPNYEDGVAQVLEELILKD